MKTFDTEKHNIPEGATHYSDDNDLVKFRWFKLTPEKGWLMMTNTDTRWWRSENFNYNHYNIKPIPQTKDAEWVNGDKCRYANDIEHEYIYIGEHPHGDGHYVFSEDKGITYIANGHLIEPETEAEKLERERNEEIDKMALIVEMKHGFAGDAYRKYCASLYDAGYRKEFN